MLTFTVLCLGVLKLSSRTRKQRVKRVDRLCDAGSSDRNSELVSNSVALRGVDAIGAAPTLPPLRNITIVLTNYSYTW